MGVWLGWGGRIVAKGCFVADVEPDGAVVSGDVACFQVSASNGDEIGSAPNSVNCSVGGVGPFT